MSASNNPPSEVELIKDASNFLRGTIVESLNDRITYAIAADDTQLSKFHGFYQQDDRDIRSERRRQKLEPAFIFMLRVGVPGGLCSADQWLAMDRLAKAYGNDTLKLTTRQAFQVHEVLKPHLKPLIRGVNEALMTSLSACGDVNRNVLCSPHPYDSPIHDEVMKVCEAVSDHLKPKTTAYQEIWMGTEKMATGEFVEEEPIYGKTYLPRKFKIAFAIPPYNDSALFTNDLGYIAIEENGKLAGFNITTGGGMGMTYGETETYPRLADVIGFCPADKAVEVGEHIVKIQRDFGDRSNRKHARFKYTIDDRGVDWLKDELAERLGWRLEEPRPFTFTSTGDQFDWRQARNGNWFITIHVEGGRVRDDDKCQLMTALRKVAEAHDGDFRLTANQNVVIGNVSDANKANVDAILKEHGVIELADRSAMRLNSIACVALNTCALAMAESERYLPDLIDRLDPVLQETGLQEQPITVRMSGCPNGCGRPYVGEVGFTGKAPGKYAMYLGASGTGERLNKLYKENIGEDEIVADLEKMLRDYAANRTDGESFGDFVIRADYVKATTHGTNFHA